MFNVRASDRFEENQPILPSNSEVEHVPFNNNKGFWGETLGVWKLIRDAVDSRIKTCISSSPGLMPRPLGSSEIGNKEIVFANVVTT